MSLSPYRGFISGREGFLGSERVFAKPIMLTTACLLMDGSQVCFLRLEVDLGSFLGSAQCLEISKAWLP